MELQELRLSIEGTSKLKKHSQSLARVYKSIWIFVLSLWFWFNTYTIPAVMLFPDLNKQLYNLLLLNELVWICEAIRRLMFNAREG